MRMRPVCLTIAGSDCSGGAGLQADLKTFHQFGAYGTSAVTLVTVQNTVRVSRVEILPPELVTQQILAVIEDLPPAAAKTGALGSAAVVRAVAGILRETAPRFPLVVDPVMISKHGTPLLDEPARAALCDHLLPLAALVTPNIEEAAALARMPVRNISEMREAARRISAFGPRAVLVKGGHLEGDALDLLYTDGHFLELTSPRFDTPHTHGTGCTSSAAITAGLALGASLEQAVRAAKEFITEAIRTAPGLGHGHGPVNHWASRYNQLSRHD